MEDMTSLPDSARARSLLGMRGAFEGVARWPWMASEMGTDDARTPPTNRSRRSAQRVVEKLGRSITNSETPQVRAQDRLQLALQATDDALELATVAGVLEGLPGKEQLIADLQPDLTELVLSADPVDLGLEVALQM